jgi:hypothetical protein
MIKNSKNQQRIKPVLSFTLDRDLVYYIKTKCLEQSKFVNRAIRVFLDFIYRPEKLMRQLRRMYPEEYKKVGRLKTL